MGRGSTRHPGGRIGITLVDQIAADNPSVTKGWVDAGFKNAVIDHGAALGIDIEVPARSEHERVRACAARWIVEQTFGTLLLHRRLAPDYETLPARAASWIRWSMTDIMPRRLTGHRADLRDPLPIGARAPTGEAAHA